MSSHKKAKPPQLATGAPEIFQARRTPVAPTPRRPKIQAVYIGRTQIGYVRARATGFEALDRNRRRIGVFSTLREAAAAIPEAAQ
jgi:hypothetical protein